MILQVFLSFKIRKRVLLVEFEMAFNSLGKAKDFLFLVRHSHYLYTDRHSLSVFEVGSYKLGDGVLPVTFVMSFLFSGDGNRLRTCGHPEQIINVGVGSQ